MVLSYELYLKSPFVLLITIILSNCILGLRESRISVRKGFWS